MEKDKTLASHLSPPLSEGVGGRLVTLEDIKNLVAHFSDESYGADRPFQAVLYHLKRETDSAMSTGEMEDFVDMQCLLLDAFRKRFPDVDTQTLIDFCKEKIEVIIPARTWKKIGQS